MKNRIFSFINIFGLATGIACSLLIFLFIRDELSYDRFHKDSDNIYRIVKDVVNEDGSRIPDAKTPRALATAIQREIPEVSDITRAFANPDWGADFLVKYRDKKFNEGKIFWVDSTFFDVFTFPFVQGNAKSALNETNSIVITESIAKKYFGNENPMGKTLQVDQFLGALIVTGVLKDLPSNSHFHFDFAASIKKLGGDDPNNDWGWDDFYTYAKLKPHTNVADFTKKVEHIFKQRIPAGRDIYYTQPLTGIHLTSNLKSELEPNSDKLYIYVFSIIGIFIILIAGINYVNLATAKASIRAKEVGIRKVAGASRPSLINQFLVESVITCLVASVLAIVIAQLLLPVVNSVTQKQLTVIGNPAVMGYIIMAALFLGIVAGFFPAIYLSSFKPVTVLKGLRVNGKGALSLRKALVVIQFTISIVLIIGALVISEQMHFIQSAKLGLNKDQVVIVKNAWSLSDAEKDAFQNSVLQIPGVKKIATSDGIIGGQNSTDEMHFEGLHNSQPVNSLSVGNDFLDVLGMELKEGRSFSAKFPSDVMKNVPNDHQKEIAGSVIINETAVKSLNVPEPAIGKNIFWRGNYVKIIGVVKDFHFTSFRTRIKPFAFVNIPYRMGNFMIKLSTDNVKVALVQLENTWKKFSSEKPFEYVFLDETYAKLYQSENRFQKVFTSLVILGIIISCLGLLGLTTFAAQQRIKEIGIRKVLGASVSEIVRLLSKDFLELILIALLIAIPIAWFFMNKWLQDFAYRINIQWWVFMAAAIIAMLVAFATIWTQAIKAAMANPVKNLRTE